MIEYAIARLAALKSRFVTSESLQRLLLTKDHRTLAAALSESVFREEMDSLMVKGEGDPSPAALLRLIHEGHARLRLFFSGLVKSAYPALFDSILARWELEEIKAGLRYLSSRGPTLERRFRFTSYFADPKETRSWGECKTVREFFSILVKKNHPMAAFIDIELFGKDQVRAEGEMERRFFTGYFAVNKSASPLRQYFSRRMDAVNIHVALLMRDHPIDSLEMRERFLEGPGTISFADFQALAKTPSLREAVDIVKKRLGLSLGPSAEESPARLSTHLQKSFFHQYKKNRLLEPGGLWAFLFFMEALDAMVEDLKLALYFRAAGVPPQEAEIHFITA